MQVILWSRCSRRTGSGYQVPGTGRCLRRDRLWFPSTRHPVPVTHMAHRNHDELFMKQALDLARQGIGLASPNPCVGALIVDERGRIVGRGTHTYEGKKHAEILAIEEAGDKARGNTLYISLEPCSHVGRTGPCADAVIEAGIQRVVASMRDPNPQVSGEGFARLRAAGIEVLEGIFEEPARKLNEAFARYIRTRMPFGILKTAMTLDGKI